MLGQIERHGEIVIADFEAGLGTLSRVKPGHLDRVLIVTEPTVKSLDVARRALAMIRERGIGDAWVVANRLSADSDRALVDAALGPERIFGVPDDQAVRDASRVGISPLDAAPDAPAVAALGRLARSLAE